MNGYQQSSNIYNASASESNGNGNGNGNGNDGFLGGMNWDATLISAVGIMALLMFRK